MIRQMIRRRSHALGAVNIEPQGGSYTPKPATRRRLGDSFASLANQTQFGNFARICPAAEIKLAAVTN